MKVIKNVRTGFMVPLYGGWEITSGLSGKPELFWRGAGRYAINLTGKKAWEGAEVPDPPREPDKRLAEGSKYKKWFKTWLAYAEEHGPACASAGLNMCDLYKVKDTFSKMANAQLTPPNGMHDSFQRLFNAPLMAFSDPFIMQAGGGWSFDIFRFMKCLMPLKGDSLDKFEARDESAKEWFTKHWGTPAADLVESLITWRPDEAKVNTHREIVNAYCKLRDDAMQDTRKLKR